MSTTSGKIGNKGEMYLPINIRKQMDLHPGTKVKFIVLPNGKLIVEKIPTLEDLINKKSLLKTSFEEIEKESENKQSEMIENA